MRNAVSGEPAPDQNADATTRAIRDVLAGRRSGGALLFVGPAVIASIAYMDPGNFATNIQAGAKYGYLLLWVVLMANLTAMLFQSLSARLGIVTGKSLAQLSRENFPRPLVWVMWVISEIGAMATDLAEFLGAAIGLSLLFGIPLMGSLVVTGVAVYAMLMLQRGGFRPAVNRRWYGATRGTTSRVRARRDTIRRVTASSYGTAGSWCTHHLPFRTRRGRRGWAR